MTTIIAPNTEAAILGFTLPQQTGIATIDAMNFTIAIEVENGTSLISLSPTITLSDGATVSPNNLEAQDFTNPVTYTVTAEDGTSTQEWVVTVSEEFVLGIEDQLLSNRLYPNPANRQIAIDLADFSKEPIIISITNVSGHVIEKELAMGGAEVLISVDDYTAGVYIIHINQNERSLNLRFVKN